MRYLEAKGYVEVFWCRDESGCFEWLRLLPRGIDLCEASIAPDPGVRLLHERQFNGENMSLAETGLTNGFRRVSKHHVILVDDRPIVVRNVPMLLDRETDEVFLALEIANKLYDLLRHPERKSGVTTADVYEWDEPLSRG